VEHKILCIELYTVNKKIHEDIKRVCSGVRGSSMEYDQDNKSYVITTDRDISNDIARVLLDNNMPIKNFYTKEPNLEDAIIKLAKGA
jgi:DNA polymerase II small subunit/DNA polymerase delta subunit B